MPKIFRTMLPDESGAKPKIGCESGPGLGVRISIPYIPDDDIHPDPSGNVGPRGGGMSVAPSIGALLPHLIPKRLSGKYAKANGSNKRFVWSFGDGPFVDAALAERLVLRVETAIHGLVEPDSMVPVDDFQNALAGTQNGWRKDED